MRTKYFWAMKKAQKPLIWDTFSVTNRNSHKYFEIPHILTNSKIIDGDIYFDEDAVNNMRDSIRENINKDIDYPNKIAKKFCRLRDEVLAITNKVNFIDLKEISEKELIDLFSECFEQIGLIECFMSFRGNVELSDVLTEKIKQALVSKLNKISKLELLEEYFLLLSIPKKDSYMIKLQNNILKIGSLIQKDKNTEEEIKNLHKNFSWTGCSMFDGEHVSIDKFREDTNSKLDLNCKEELEKQEKEKIVRELKIKKLVNELEFNEEEKKHLENLREWFFLRTYAKDIVSMTVADTMIVLNEIAKRSNIDKKDIVNLRKKEIESVFEAPKEKMMNIISKRKERYGVEVTNDKIKFFSGDDVSKIEEKEDTNLNVNEVKGTVASQGKVKGIVRYLIDATELDKIQKGDILVTSMTTTDFTPILDKLSALVTDEGGLTCHAAIVSRELGIPCVIGTRIATKVFKDNDKIEVDAINGIVKKI